MVPAKKTQEEKLLGIRTSSVVIGKPLPYDLFIKLGGKTVLFRKIGDVLTSERARTLVDKGGDHLLFIQADQKRLHLDSLQAQIRDPDLKTEERGKVLKEAAFIHVNDLFTQQDLRPAVKDAESLVEDMVSFVSSDMGAVTNLLNLSRHDYYTYNHSVDVAVYSIVLAKRIYGTDDKNILITAGLAGLLHDIGKRGIDKTLINKATDLSAQEWELMRKHPEFGHDYVKNIDTVPEDSKLAVLQHHENFDGTGYPAGLDGESISRLARVVSIADVFDALTTKRSYHEPVTASEALSIMQGMQPGKFDPGIFKSFDKRFQTRMELALNEKFDPCHELYSNPLKK